MTDIINSNRATLDVSLGVKVNKKLYCMCMCMGTRKRSNKRIFICMHKNVVAYRFPLLSCPNNILQLLKAFPWQSFFSSVFRMGVTVSSVHKKHKELVHLL